MQRGTRDSQILNRMSSTLTFLGTETMRSSPATRGDGTGELDGQGMMYRETVNHPNHLTLEIDSQMEDKRAERANEFFCERSLVKKLQPSDEIVKVDEELGMAWKLLPPDATLGGFQGISPRIKDKEKFTAAKKKSEKEKG